MSKIMYTPKTYQKALKQDKNVKSIVCRKKKI